MEKDKKPPPSPPPKADPDPPFSHDISRMPDFPPRATAHRRAQSEILSLPDDLSFDTDLGVVADAAGPSLSDEAFDDDIFSAYIDFDKFGSAGSLDDAPVPPPAEGSSSSSAAAMEGERPRMRHQHSQSMDGSSSIKTELLGGSGGEGPSLADTKKAMSAAKLADLALVDPKRAKRIWANRQSAARSKERKMRYIAELERKVQSLQTEATALSAQLTMLQRDTANLTTENSELKIRLQSAEQQVHVQDAINDSLRDEVQRLKMMTGQVLVNGGQMMNYGSASFGGNQQFYPPNHAMQSILAAHQFQQLHLHSHQQLMMHPNPLQHQHQQQLTPLASSDLKSKGPMVSHNENQQDGAFDTGNSMVKD